MNRTLSKALTGAAWFLVGLGALKEVWRTSPLPTNKNRSKSNHKRAAERKELSDSSSEQTSTLGQ